MKNIKICFLFLMLTVGIVGLLGEVNAVTLNVGTGQTYTTIQSAIDAANSGDTILVRDGTYDEILSITKSNLTIKANSGEHPMIHPSASFSGIRRLIDIRGNNVTLEGFEIVGNNNLGFDNSYVGVSISGQEVVIKDNSVRELLTGIQTTTQNAVGNVDILNNEVSHTYVGISLQNNNNLVDGNTLSDVSTEGMGIGNGNTNQNNIRDNNFDVNVGGVNVKDYNSGVDLLGIVRNNHFEKLATIQNSNGGILGDALYVSIQDAINAATAGSIINVGAGMYNERITINKSLTLRGATYSINKNGYVVPAGYSWNTNVESVINNPSPVLTDLVSVVNIKDTDNVVFEGFVVQSLNAPQGSANDMLVTIAASTKTVNNIKIKNNVIGPNTNITSQNGTSGRMGLYLSVNQYREHPYGITNSNISGNKIFNAKGNGNNVFIWGPYYSYGARTPSPMEGTVIEDNEIYGSHRSGIETSGGISGLTIRNNKIYGNSGNAGEETKLKYGHGILVDRGSSDRTITGLSAVNLTIENNEIYNNQKSGIYFGPMNKNYTIKSNNIHNNGWDGIMLDFDGSFCNPNFETCPHPIETVRCYDCTENLNLNLNKISNNAEYGVHIVSSGATEFVLDAKNNYWGSANPIFTSLISGNANYAPWFKDADLKQLDLANIIVENTTAGTKEVTLPVTEFEVSTSLGVVDVLLPENVVITGNMSWTGVLNAPSLKENTYVTAVASKGNKINSTESIIELGISNLKLTFNKAVRIFIPGQAGKLAGYSVAGTDFTPITAICTSDIEATNTASLAEGGDCKLDVGSDLVIWTKHFTSFVTYTEVPKVNNNNYNSNDYRYQDGESGETLLISDIPSIRLGNTPETKPTQDNFFTRLGRFLTGAVTGNSNVDSNLAQGVGLSSLLTFLIALVGLAVIVKVRRR